MRASRHSFPLTLPLWIAALGLAGCAAIAPPSPEPPPAGAERPAVPVTGNADSYVATIEANRALLFRQVPEAIRWFEAAAQADPHSPYLQTTLGRVYLDMHQSDRAIEHLKKALEIDPGYADAQFLLARVYTSADPARAAASYEAILAANPEDPGALFQLALLRVRENKLDLAQDLLTRLVAVDSQSFQALSMLAQVEVSLNHYDDAEKHFLAALELQPDSERALIELAVLYERWGKIEPAVTTYQKVLDVNPDNHQVRHRLSQLLLHESRIGDAVNELTELTKRDPEPFEARLELGLIFLEQERVDDAVTEFTLLLKERPDLVKASYYLGLALAKKGDVDGALDALAKVDPSVPEYVDSRLRMGILLTEERNDPDGAIKVLQDALEHATPANDQADTPATVEADTPTGEPPTGNQQVGQDPRVRLYRVLAFAQEKAGRVPLAIDALEKAKELGPEDTNVLFDLGVLYDKQGRAADAEREMRAVINRDPKHARALNYLGYTWADQGVHLDEAEQLIRRALEVEPDDGYYVDSLGWVQFRRGKFDDAAKTLEHAVELVPEDPVITEHLGDAYAKAGKKDRAAATYRRVLELDPAKTDVQKKLDAIGGGPNRDEDDRPHSPTGS